MRKIILALLVSFLVLPASASMAAACNEGWQPAAEKFCSKNIQDNESNSGNTAGEDYHLRSQVDILQDKGADLVTTRENARDLRRVENNIVVNKFNICRYLSSPSASYTNLVPFKTSAEWVLYLNNRPAGTTAVPCAITKSGQTLTTACGSVGFSWLQGKQGDTQTVSFGTFERSQQWQYMGSVNGVCKVLKTEQTSCTTKPLTWTAHANPKSTGPTEADKTADWIADPMPSNDCDPQPPGYTPPTKDGECGSANGGTFQNAPGSGLCAEGTASAVTSTATQWKWSCASSTGNTAQCAASRVTDVAVTIESNSCTTQKADFAILIDASASMENEIKNAKKALKKIMGNPDFKNVRMSVVSIGGDGHRGDAGREADIRDSSCQKGDNSPTYNYSYNRNGQLIIVSTTPSERIAKNQNFGHVAGMKNWDPSDLADGGTLDKGIDALTTAPLTPIGKAMRFAQAQDLQSEGRQHAMVVLSDGIETCYDPAHNDNVIAKIQDDDTSVFGIRYTGNGSSAEVFNTMDKVRSVDVTDNSTDQNQRTQLIVDALENFINSITTCSLSVDIFDSSGTKVAKIRDGQTKRIEAGVYKVVYNLCNTKLVVNNLAITVDSRLNKPGSLKCPD